MKSSAAILFATAAAIALPARADQIRAGSSSIAIPQCEDPGRPIVGYVVAQSGAASAQFLDCPPQPLACDAAVRGGDVVSTGADSRIAFLAEQLYVQLASGSELAVGQTPEGAPDLVLRRGSLRVIDQQEIEVGPPHRIATAHAETLAHGNDTEAYLVSVERGAESGICEWAAPIEVRRLPSGVVTTARPGECVLAAGGRAPAAGPAGAGLAASPGGSLRVSLADVERCEIADVGRDLVPVDVAAGPPVPGFPLEPPVLPPPPLCENGACNPPVRGIPVVESPPGYEPPP